MATPEHHRAGLERDPDAPLGAGAGGRLGRRRRRLGARAAAERPPAPPAAHQQAPQQRAAAAAAARDDRRHRHRADRRRARLPPAGGRARASCEVKVARNIDQQHARDRRVRAVALDRRAGGRGRRADRHHRRRRRRALPRGDVGHRSAPALGAGGAAARSRGSVVGHDLRRPPPAQGRVRRGRRARWCSTSPSRRAIAHRERAPARELRRRERQVEALNRRLERELAARREELSGMQAGAA